MGRNLLTATFDAATELKDAGAITSSAAAQVGGVARVVNLGTAFAEMSMNVDVDALTTAAADQSYRVTLQGSTSPTFASDVNNLASITVGHATATGNSATSTTGRYQTAAMNSKDGATPLPYVRAYITVAGTGSPSINCRVWLTKSPL